MRNGTGTDYNLPPAHTSSLNKSTSHTVKQPCNAAMNNSAMRSATSRTADGLWLQVMKPVSGPVLIFPHFLSSQCKWRGINLEYRFAGAEWGVNCSFGNSRGVPPPSSAALRLLASMCLRGLCSALLSLLVSQPAAFHRSRGSTRPQYLGAVLWAFFPQSPNLLSWTVNSELCRSCLLATDALRVTKHSALRSFCDQSTREHLEKQAQNVMTLKSRIRRTHRTLPTSPEQDASAQITAALRNTRRRA